MELFWKKFFEKKALWDRTGFSYSGATFWYNTELETNTALYYKLYRENTDLRRCVEELYQTSWKDWYKLYQWENELRNSNIENILNFENWFWMLKAIIIRDLQIAWNVFILPVRNWLNNIIWYQVLDPRTIRVVANKYWEVIRYIQTRWWNTQEFWADEIFHFKDMIDPDNEVIWISKIETLVYDIMADKESWRSNYAFFKNNAIPSTLITLENDLDENEVRNAINTLKQQFSWGSKRHKITASMWIKDVKQLWWGIWDMEFAVLRWFTTERICSAMWVPKTILWYSDWVNYSTSDNQFRKYIENTIRPLQHQIEFIFNKLIQAINPNIKLEFLDLNQFDFSQKIIDFEKLVWIWVMTPAEVREAIWYDAINDENMNKLLIKQWYELLEDVWVNEIQQIPNNI
jgi:HK97 family phage portal protein